MDISQLVHNIKQIKHLSFLTESSTDCSNQSHADASPTHISHAWLQICCSKSSV